MKTLHMSIKLLASTTLAFSSLMGASAAEWLGTGADTLWGTKANWESSTGIPVGNIAFSAKAGDNKTVTLDGNNSFNGTFNVSAGTAEAPFVFTAIDATEELVPTLNQTSTSGLDVTGALKIEKGTWNFANDILPNGGYLWVAGGRVTTKYWIPVKGVTTIRVDGGELVSGYRDGGEQDNGRLELGTTRNSEVTLLQTGGRIRCSNNTNKGNDAEALTVGSEADSTATVTLTGGELVVNGKTHIGFRAVKRAEILVDGGAFTTTHDILVGRDGAGTLTVSNGTVTCGTPAEKRWLCLGNGTAGGTLNLHGGTLSVSSLRHGNGTAASLLSLNGGTLAPNATEDSFIPAHDNLTVTVGEKGAIIDTATYRAGIHQALVSGVAEGTDGGLVKKGLGRLDITGATTYTGPTVVENGVLGVVAGHEFGGKVVIGTHGAMSVDLTGKVDGETAEGDKILLFKATAVEFAYANDTLAEAIFLAGPVIGCTLAFEEGWVVATVTDVANVSQTRKVTSYVVQDDYIDQDRSWSNGMPANKSYDTIVFCADATMNVYAKTWGDGSNRACDTLVLRGATVLAQHPDNWNPCLDKRHIVGHGTLQLRRLGLECRQAPGTEPPTVGANVAVEIVRTSANSDTWNVSPIIYGTLTASTGYTIFNNDSKLYGDCRWANPERNSYISNGSMTGTYIGGVWTIEDGCHFDFNGAVVECGQDATLVLKGSAWIEDAQNVAFPTLVLGEGCQRTYAVGSIDAVGEKYVVDGGQLTVTPGEVEGLRPVVYKSGALLVDASGVEVEVGSVLTIPYVSLADGLSAGDVTIHVGGSTFAWVPSLDETGKIVITAQEAGEGPTRWIGGASGDWNVPANWSRGVPTESQIVQIPYSAQINMSKDFKVGTFDVPEGVRVELHTTNVGSVHPTLRPSAMTGNGTIALYHAGIIPSQAMTIPETLTIEIVDSGSDSWLEGDESGKALTVNANIVGNGTLYLRDWLTLGGDNSGFSGRIVKESNYKEYKHPNWVEIKDGGSLTFASASAGSANAAWDINCDVYTTFTSGTLHFGNLILRNRRGWYMANDGVTTYSIGALGQESNIYSEYFFGSSYWNDPAEVPMTTVELVGGKLVYGGKGLRKVDVKGGELALVESVTYDGAADVFDNRGGKQIDAMVVRGGATLSGSAGDQPIQALTLEEGAILKTTLSEVTEGEVVQSAQPVVDGDVTIEGQGAIVQVDGAELVKTGDKLTLLSVTGEGHAITGTAALKEGTVLPTDPSNPNKVWRIRNKATRLELGEGIKGFIVIIQ